VALEVRSVSTQSFVEEGVSYGTPQNMVERIILLEKFLRNNGLWEKYEDDLQYTLLTRERKF
jgi:hypothetical protein